MDESQYKVGAIEREYMLRKDFKIAKRPDGVSAEEQIRRNAAELEKRQAQIEQGVAAIKKFAESLGDLTRQVATGEVSLTYKNSPKIKIKHNFNALKSGNDEIRLGDIESALLAVLVDAKKNGDARVHYGHAENTVAKRPDNHSGYPVDRDTIANARKRLNAKIKKILGVERAIMVKNDYMWLDVGYEIVNW